MKENIERIIKSKEIYLYTDNKLEVYKNKIITDIGVINNSIIEKIKKDINGIYKLSPTEFEHFMAEIFEKQGYNVKITKQTRDGGKDLLIIEDKLIGSFLIYADCKRNAPNRPVGISLVKQLYGTVMADRATAGLLITTSYFSPDAHKFTKTIKNQMSLMDLNTITQLLYEK